MAGVIGVGTETLKAYENGKRTLPFDVFYKLIQFLKLRISCGPGVIHIACKGKEVTITSLEK